jgi:hypothetical protein
MDIQERLKGDRTREELHQMQYEPECQQNSGKFNSEVSAEVEGRLRALNSADDIRNKKIPFAKSEVLQRREDDHLSVEFLREKMKSPLYWDRNFRNEAFCRAIQDGFAELSPQAETTDEGIRPGMVLHSENAPANENAAENDYSDVINRYRQSLANRF